MTDVTREFGAHVLHLDVVTGAGVLVEPDPVNDVDNPVLIPNERSGIDGATSSHGSLFAGEWSTAVGWLHANGWSLVDYEAQGRTQDGRSLWLLNHSDGTEDERRRIEAFERLIRLAAS